MHLSYQKVLLLDIDLAEFCYWVLWILLLSVYCLRYCDTFLQKQNFQSSSDIICQKFKMKNCLSCLYGVCHLGLWATRSQHLWAVTLEEGDKRCKAKERRSETHIGILTALQVMEGAEILQVGFIFWRSPPLRCAINGQERFQQQRTRISAAQGCTEQWFLKAKDFLDIIWIKSHEYLCLNCDFVGKWFLARGSLDNSCKRILRTDFDLLLQFTTPCVYHQHAQKSCHFLVCLCLLVTSSYLFSLSAASVGGWCSCETLCRSVS